MKITNGILLFCVPEALAVFLVVLTFTGITGDFVLSLTSEAESVTFKGIFELNLIFEEATPLEFGFL